VSYFLVIYDRRRQRDPEVEEIADGEVAQQRLFEIEDELHADPERGVVMLRAAREEDLRRTHAQYFERVDDLSRAVTA
jgi:hypothetical protein